MQHKSPLCACTLTSGSIDRPSFGPSYLLYPHKRNAETTSHGHRRVPHNDDGGEEDPLPSPLLLLVLMLLLSMLLLLTLLPLPPSGAAGDDTGDRGGSGSGADGGSGDRGDDTSASSVRCGCGCSAWSSSSIHHGRSFASDGRLRHGGGAQGLLQQLQGQAVAHVQRPAVRLQPAGRWMGGGW